MSVTVKLPTQLRASAGERALLPLRDQQSAKL